MSETIQEFDKKFIENSLDGICLCWNQEQTNLPIDEIGDKYYLFKLAGSASQMYIDGGVDYLAILESAVYPGIRMNIKVPTQFVARVNGLNGENIRSIAKIIKVPYILVEEVPNKKI